MERGGDIYAVESNRNKSEKDGEKFRIASEITSLMLAGKFSDIPSYGNELVSKLTPDLIESVWNKVLLTNGKFVSVGEQSMEGNTVTTKLNFEKRTVDFNINISVGVVTVFFFHYIDT